MDEAPIFRAVKRRKHVHKQDSPDTTSGSDDETPSHLIKSRTLPRARLKGVQFTNQKIAMNEADNIDTNHNTAIQQNSESNTYHGINNRFVGSITGQVVNVDKHMMAYVDQQMAKKHSSAPPASSTISRQHADSHPHSRSQSHNDEDDEDASSSTSPSDDASSPLPPAAASMNRHHISSTSATSFQPLAEVDLATSATTAATTKPPRRKGPRRPRLGRDGKPFRPRARKRRDSDDIARDGLVEQVLHETAPHGLASSSSTDNNNNIVTTTTSAGANSSTKVDDPATQREQRQGNNEALDEKVAADFQRQFLDAVSERRQLQQHRHNSNNSSNSAKAKAKAGSAGAGGVNAQHGPRLGGSRSVRARIMAAQAQAQAQAANTVEGKDAARSGNGGVGGK